ncbi:hypothetical protein SM124_22220 [Bacillus sp. 31A1R]|uniref:Uncharacterized protein n=1 Tax=Robertmurraya mangrovi TaxID=3098077 RepID=A0ABU5J4R9_9BACI|nr:hypothetical protein [Bacillus sp. 31A1R]MDZ5474414.1 hypothetical protein [Bacillus sp. 31A1R]
MSKKVTSFTLLPVFFSMWVFWGSEDVYSVIFVLITILPYFCFNIYLDMTKKSSHSRKIRGLSAYIGMIIVSLYLLYPALTKISPLITSLIFLIVTFVSYKYRESIARILFSRNKEDTKYRASYWIFALVLILLGGGGYYPTTKRVIERWGEHSEVFYSTFSFLFSIWILIFAQGSIAKFTKFKG